MSALRNLFEKIAAINARYRAPRIEMSGAVRPLADGAAGVPAGSGRVDGLQVRSDRDAGVGHGHRH
jgi:hypothetical protein